MSPSHKNHDPPDERAVLRAAQDDPAAFSPLYEAYFPRVYAYCARRTGTTHEAEDLTSVIFTRALRGVGGYRGGNVGAWLFRIAHNEVVNYWRRRAEDVSLDANDMDFAASDPSPVEQVIRLEQQAAVRRAVAQLPPDQQDLLALKLGGELTSAQIGEVLGKSAGAVRVELHRIIQQLRLLYFQEESS